MIYGQKVGDEQDHAGDEDEEQDQSEQMFIFNHFVSEGKKQ